MYRRSLLNTKKMLDFEPEQQEEKKPRSLVSPRQQQKQGESSELRYDPLEFLREGMRRIREAASKPAQEFSPPSRRRSGASKQNQKPSKELSTETHPDMVESISDEGIKVTENAAHYGLVKRPNPRSGDGFLGLIDRHEGGGDYNALLGFSNRNQFKGVNVTEMTLAEIDRFAKGEYAQWSKQWKAERGHGNPNVPSTPMGRYQFVNTTLQAQARQMGLPKDTKFTPEVQDAMFENYLKQRMRRGSTPEEKMSQIRQAWEGFKSVPNQRLLELINQMEA